VPYEWLHRPRPLEGFTRQMKRLPGFLRESLTYHRGTETRAPTDCCANFCPRAWNSPRSVKPSSTTSLVCANGRPRQTLGWATPEEALAKELERADFAKRCT
jgi:IS30 family transposase